MQPHPKRISSAAGAGESSNIEAIAFRPLPDFARVPFLLALAMASANFYRMEVL
jgi:hypothetical protein